MKFRATRPAHMASLLVLALFCAGLTPVAGAASERLFERLDSNGDGRVTLEELQSQQIDRYLRADADGDRRITRAEFVALLQATLSRAAQRSASRNWMRRMDRDGDGTLSDSELAEAAGRMFDRLDRDRDGVLTEVELIARSKRMFERADANGDGAIDRREAQRIPLGRE